MPFKSEAQRRKFQELVELGKMDQSTFDEWDKATPHGIPERVSSQKAGPTVVKVIRPIKIK